MEAGILELSLETRSEASGSYFTEDQKQRTAKYVSEQAAVTSEQQIVPPKTENVALAPPFQSVVAKQEINPNYILNQAASDNSFATPLHTSFKPFAPAIQTVPKAYNTHNNYALTQPTYDLAKYLSRSQLITTGLSAFDDQPMNYWVWKSSFKSAKAGLDLSAGEELDLLIRYLGKDSAKQAKQMKAVNIRCPEAGLMRAWERLEETHGSTEAIEQALFQKVENFPKITNREPLKLRDLADLLLELEAAKLDGYLPGLSYLDTARGIQPIISKLPSNIQEKWMTYGSKYKHDHGTSFPPFTVFANFIRTEAKTRTDPSFNLHSSQQPIAERKHCPERFP